MATITNIKERINQLSPGEFQILCDSYLAREGYQNFVSLGTMAGTNKTTKGTPDSYLCDENGNYIFAEYTTQTNGLVDKINEDLDKCLNSNNTGIPLSKLVEIVYCHTSSNISPENDLKFREKCEKSNVKLTLVGIDKLAESIYTKYQILAKEHLNLSIDSEQIQTYDDFVKQYDNNKTASPIQTLFMFREDELKSIDVAFKNNNIVLLSGPSGIGKTRLALQYAKTRSETTGEILFCVHSRSLPLFDDVSFYFEKPGNYFVFIDDANQLSQIEHILALTNKVSEGYNVKILMSVRDYALQKVIDSVCGIVQYKTISIGIFSDEQIKKIVNGYYKTLNDKCLDRIAQISEGNARIAMLAANVAYNSNRIDSIDDTTKLYADYYGKILAETSVISKPEMLKSLGVVSFINSFNLNNIETILKPLGMDFDSFKKCLYELHDLEIVDIYHDQAVVFSEQCLSNYLLKYVFCDKKMLSLSAMIKICFLPYKSRTINSVSTLLNVFRNDDVVSFVTKEICQIWNELKSENSPHFFEYIMAFHPANPTEALLLLKEKIDTIENVDILPEEIDRSTGKNYQNVNDDILTILGNFADTENIEAALDLFFTYYLKRPDLYMKFYHAIVLYYSINKQSYDFGYMTQRILLNKFKEYSDEWNNKYICLLFLDVSKELSKIMFSPAETSRNDKSFIIYHIAISLTDGIEKYREQLWKNILKLAENKNYHPAILDIFAHYGNGIETINKSVVKFDSQHICNILLNCFSASDLNICLRVKHLLNVFKWADLQISNLNSFIDNPKMFLYNLLCGSEWDIDTDYSTHESERKNNIIGYLHSKKDITDSFRNLFQLYLESLDTPDCDRYKISSGINIAIESLTCNSETLTTLLKPIVASERIDGIDYNNITAKLFTVMNKDNVIALLKTSPYSTANIWMYSYFAMLPQDSADKEQLDKLYDFLCNDSDKVLQSSGYRNISFLEKFLDVDEDVIIKASNIILEKKSYSPFMVGIYFNLLFNEHCHKPDEVLKMYSKDISILERIYLCLEHENNNFDFHGEYLYLICHADNSFLLSFAHLLVSKKMRLRVDEINEKCLVFYKNDNYTDLIDVIVDEAFIKCDFPENIMPSIYRNFIAHAKESTVISTKIDNWVKHFISKNIACREKIKCLFISLSELSMEQHIKYLSILIQLDNDYELFDSIPLTPMSYSWSGSAIPLYSLWIKHLQSLLPMLHGIVFMKHKQRVEDMIDRLRQAIKSAEINEALNG